MSKTHNLTFSEALVALKSGRHIRRAGWGDSTYCWLDRREDSEGKIFTTLRNSAGNTCKNFNVSCTLAEDWEIIEEFPKEGMGEEIDSLLAPRFLHMPAIRFAMDKLSNNSVVAVAAELAEILLKLPKEENALKQQD